METKLRDAMLSFKGTLTNLWVNGYEEESTSRVVSAIDGLRKTIGLKATEEKCRDVENLKTLKKKLESMKGSFPALKDEFGNTIKLLDTGIKEEIEEERRKADFAKKRSSLCADILKEINSNDNPKNRVEKLCELLNDKKLNKIMDEYGWDHSPAPDTAEIPSDPEEAKENAYMFLTALEDKYEFLDSVSGVEKKSDEKRILRDLLDMVMGYYKRK